MPTLTPDEIREQFKRADTDKAVKLLRLRNCPLDIVEKHAFIGYSRKDYDAANRRVCDVARASRLLSSESITEYISRGVDEHLPYFIFWGLYGFFRNPNFSADILSGLLSRKNLAKKNKLDILRLIVEYRKSPIELLDQALPYDQFYLALAKHPNISNEIARKIISDSYADTLLTLPQAQAMMKRKGYDLNEYSREYVLETLKGRNKELKLALIRNPKTSVEVLSELIPSDEAIASRQSGLPELLRALLRSMPVGADRQRVVEILSNLKQPKVHPMTTKLIAHATTDQEALRKLAYGRDKELRNIAANNPAIKPEDKVFVVLNSGRIKPTRIKTRF